MNNFIVLVVCALVSIYLINKNSVKTEVAAQSGQFSNFGKYANVTPLKHDVFKQFFVVFTSLMFFDASFVGKPLFDSTNPFGSIVGRGIIISSLFAVFHGVVQPLINYLPSF